MATEVMQMDTVWSGEKQQIQQEGVVQQWQQVTIVEKRDKASRCNSRECDDGG